MIEQIIAHGGYFVEADEASPIMGFPEALDLDFKNFDGDWAVLIKEIEKAVVEKGASGRLGTWTASLVLSHALAMVDFGRLVVEGKADILDFSALLMCYNKISQGAKWNGAVYVDTSLRELPNVFLIYQDTYIFGKGYLGTANLKVPGKYKAVSFRDGVINEPAEYHIAVVTGDEAQGAEDILGAKEMVKRYGSVENGGIIRHVIYSNDLVDDADATVALLESLVDDPLLKVIVVNQAIVGTTEGFRRIKAKRPDIMCLAGEPHEDPDIIAEVADLVVAGDFISRGYLIPYMAKQLGAKTMAYISFDRHMSYSSLKLKYLIMKEASEDLGLKFEYIEAQDPIAEQGVESAKDFVLKEAPKWVEKFGTDTAFYATNDAHTEPLIKQLAKYGGFFIEADIPSTLMGYPEAFELNLEPYFGEWSVILNMVEQKIDEVGGNGRFGVWVYPLGFTQTAGLTEFGKLLAEGKTTISDYSTILDCLGMFSPGAHWNGSFLNDLTSGKPLRNYFLVYQDCYILGVGYIESTKIDIPEKYYLIKIN
jgi:hypothetical protein